MSFNCGVILPIIVFFFVGSLNIRRITNHDIKAALGEYMRKLFLPVERLFAGNSGVADKRVATLDVCAEGIQFAMGLGGA